MKRFCTSAAIILISVMSAIILSGCGADIEQEKLDKQHAENLYTTGIRAIQEDRNQEAIDKFETLESSYPFSIYSKEVSLALAYLYYDSYDYEKSLAILDQFIRLNPGHENLDYAYYLKGLSHYYYGQSFISLLLKRDRTTKDPVPLIEAFNAFNTLYKLYPDSEYVRDAQLRTIVLRNMLAVYEIRIADYYLQRGAYVAVVNRIKYMLEHYEGAQHTPEGLLLLIAAYQRLHLDDLAEDTQKVLELNYPNFLQSGSLGSISKADKKNWFGKLKDGTGKIADVLKLKPKY